MYICLQRLALKNGEQAVADMVKLFRQTDKETMGGKLVVTPIFPDILSFKDKSKALEAVHLIRYVLK